MEKEKIKNIIDEIISEMKKIKYWSSEKPQNIDNSKLYSNVTFEQWIQFIYIPELLHSIEADQFDNLPQYRIGIAALRNYDYMSVFPEAEKLMYLCFDLEKIVFNWICTLPNAQNNKKFKWYKQELEKINEIENFRNSKK